MLLFENLVNAIVFKLLLENQNTTHSTREGAVQIRGLDTDGTWCARRQTRSHRSCPPYNNGGKSLKVCLLSS